ncbi:MAG TPA: hypothetical protein VIV61_18360 [Candidatus Ozemobacteraceae bacterium]
MLDALLLTAFSNMLALLPLYAALRLAQNMQSPPPLTLWEQAVASVPLMCGCIVAAVALLMWRLSISAGMAHSARLTLVGNIAVMTIVWVVLPAAGLELWLQTAAIEIWSILAAVFLLMVSFFVPLKALWRAVVSPVKPEHDGRQE